MSRTLALSIALLAAACATRDHRTWFTYQVAGETATLHARYAKADVLLTRASAQAQTPAEHARTELAFTRLAREQDDLAARRGRSSPRRRRTWTHCRRTRPSISASRSRPPRWTSRAARHAPPPCASPRSRRMRSCSSAKPTRSRATRPPAAARRCAARAMPRGARRELEVAIERFTGSASLDHVKPSEPLGLVAARTSLGRLQLAAGELEAARSSLREAAGLAGEELGTDHPVLADVLAELALVELALGDREAADRAADRAVAIASSRLPDGHPIRMAAAAAQERCAAAP